MKFCGGCGVRLDKICPECQFENPSKFKFCGNCGCELTQAVHVKKTAPETEGERKHATVLFADLSGYTAMTERLDPEEVKACAHAQPAATADRGLIVTAGGIFE